MSFRNCSLEQLQHYRRSGKWIVKFVSVSLPSQKYLDSAEWKQALESISLLWRNGICDVESKTRCVDILKEIVDTFTCSYLTLRLFVLTALRLFTCTYILCSTLRSNRILWI
uniref:Uncharacterized protein n=1 Tax=Ditylenchus dipsaci TaxID=166011 RepID=A0A915EMR6_9BILA